MIVAIQMFFSKYITFVSMFLINCGKSVIEVITFLANFYSSTNIPQFFNTRHPHKTRMNTSN